MGRSWCGREVGSGHRGARQCGEGSAPAGTAACGENKKCNMEDVFVCGVPKYHCTIIVIIIML